MTAAISQGNPVRGGLLGGCTCGRTEGHTYDCQLRTGFNLGFALAYVSHELERARNKFPAFNSPHEGYAVIREELEELWEHARADTGTGLDARVEALQIATMAIRYALDLTGTLPTGYDVEARVQSLMETGASREQAFAAVRGDDA